MNILNQKSISIDINGFILDYGKSIRQLDLELDFTLVALVVKPTAMDLDDIGSNPALKLNCLG